MKNSTMWITLALSPVWITFVFTMATFSYNKLIAYTFFKLALMFFIINMAITIIFIGVFLERR